MVRDGYKSSTFGPSLNLRLYSEDAAASGTCAIRASDRGSSALPIALVGRRVTGSYATPTPASRPKGDCSCIFCKSNSSARGRCRSLICISSFHGPIRRSTGGGVPRGFGLTQRPVGSIPYSASRSRCRACSTSSTVVPGMRPRLTKLSVSPHDLGKRVGPSLSNVNPGVIPSSC